MVTEASNMLFLHERLKSNATVMKLLSETGNDTWFSLQTVGIQIAVIWVFPWTTMWHRVMNGKQPRRTTINPRPGSVWGEEA